MTKSATLTVTVAPGCHVTVPHPSGIAELPGKVLAGGDRFSTSPETAADLYTAGLILHPETGAPPSRPVAQTSYAEVVKRAAVASNPRAAAAPRLGPSISYDGGRTHHSLAGLYLPDPRVEADPTPTSTENRAPAPPPHDCSNGGVTYEQIRDRAGRGNPLFLGPVIVEQADGRAWPSY